MPKQPLLICPRGKEARQSDPPLTEAVKAVPIMVANGAAFICCRAVARGLVGTSGGVTRALHAGELRRSKNHEQFYTQSAPANLLRERQRFMSPSPRTGAFSQLATPENQQNVPCKRPSESAGRLPRGAEHNAQTSGCRWS